MTTRKALLASLVLLGSSLAGCGDPQPQEGSGALSSAAPAGGRCAAPPLCPPGEAAVGCRCVGDLWLDVTSEPLNPDALRAVHYAGGRFWVAGDRGIVLRSLDGGQQFGRIDAGTADPFSGVSSYDGRHVLLTSAAARRLTGSDNGGLSWWQSVEGPEGLGTCTYAPDALAVCDDAGNGGRVFTYDLRQGRFDTVARVEGATGPTRVRAANALALALVERGGASALLRSTDGGRSFAPRPDLPFTVQDLWLASDDRRVLLANSGGDVYRSTDGGISFTKTLDYGPTFRPLGTTLTAEDGGHVIVVDHILASYPAVSEVWTSEDGGVSWSRRGARAFARPARGIALGDEGRAVMLVGNLAVSGDGGATFAPAEHQALPLLGYGDASSYAFFANSPARIAFPSPLRGYAVAQGIQIRNPDFQTVWRSEDGGRTMKFATPLSWYGKEPTPLAALDPEHVVVARLGTLYRSGDAGETWATTSLDDGRARAMAFVDAQRGLVLAATADSGPVVFRSVDGGATLTRVPLPAGPAYAEVAYARRTALLVDSTGGVLRSEDDGAHFAPSRAGGAGESLTTVALTRTAGTAWAGGQGAAGPLLIKSADGGRSWTAVAVPSDAGAVQRILAPGAAEVLVLFTTALYRSTDGGASWTALWRSNPLVSERAFDLYLRGTSLYLSSTHGIFRREGR